MHQIACHECDLIHDIPSMPSRAAAVCAFETPLKYMASATMIFVNIIEAAKLQEIAR